MKSFSHFKLTKELLVLFTFGVIILLLYSAIPDYYRILHVQVKLQQPEYILYLTQKLVLGW
jgi:hypothetical protein